MYLLALDDEQAARLAAGEPLDVPLDVPMNSYRGGRLAIVIAGGRDRESIVRDLTQRGHVEHGHEFTPHVCRGDCAEHRLIGPPPGRRSKGDQGETRVFHTCDYRAAPGASHCGAGIGSPSHLNLAGDVDQADAPACVRADRGGCSRPGPYRLVTRALVSGEVTGAEGPFCFGHGAEVVRRQAFGAWARVWLEPFDGR
ncbi:hypothetical protein [Micromonospora sp. NPDC049645]|uniref:hypothetical protein n=1 Tax=Micromonospora sp. NPDC049645 TaxID=3155508 RepID=UPI00342C3FE8